MSKRPKSLKKLEIWKDSIKLVKKLYSLTNCWPKKEMYGLTDQVRRAAVSVPTNIAERVGRGSSKVIARFAKISRGSLYELDTLLELASEFNYSKEKRIEFIRDEITTLSKRISSFIKYQNNK